MRHLCYTFALLLVMSIGGCQPHASNEIARTNESSRDSASTQPADRTTADQPTVIQLLVMGMSCPLCANNIEKQLRRLDGVKGVVINLGSGEVSVTVNPDRMPSREELTTAIRESGFTLDRIVMPSSASPAEEGGAP